jgi:hypothetical protein
MTIGGPFQSSSTSFLFYEVRGAASNSAYYGYPELWILRYPAQRCHAVPSPGFESMTLWLRVRRPNHSATTLHFNKFKSGLKKYANVAPWCYSVNGLDRVGQFRA